MSRVLGGYIIVAGLFAARLGAQDLQQLGKKLDSVLHEAGKAQATLLAYRNANSAASGFSDSVVIGRGKVKIFFNPELGEEARAGASEAEKQLASLGSGLDRAGNFVFTIVPDTALNYFDTRYNRTRALSVRRHIASDPRNPNRTSTDSDAKSVASVIVNAVSSAASSNAASEIKHWIAGELPLAPGVSPKPDWGALRLNLVSSASFLGRDCFRGDVRACRLFLELDSVPDRPTMHFDAAGRQRMVRFENDHALRASRVATERCLGGNDDACLTVLRMIHVSALSSPFVRASVVSHAMSLGGPQAAERLVTTPGAARDALAAAAGRPLDSLLADWQRNLNAPSGSSSKLPWSIAFSSLVWIALCVFLALRGSRWR